MKITARLEGVHTDAQCCTTSSSSKVKKKLIIIIIKKAEDIQARNQKIGEFRAAAHTQVRLDPLSNYLRFYKHVCAHLETNKIPDCQNVSNLL